MIGVIHHKDHSAFKNPSLKEEFQDSALRNRGGLNWNKETFVSLNHSGLSFSNINPESYANDYAKYWSMHERKLWITLGVCLLFLAMKLIA